MLFCYPLSAAEENWLHDGLIDLVTKALTTDDPALMTKWLASFPESKQYDVGRKPSLLQRLSNLVEAVRKLDTETRRSVLACMQSQNALPHLFNEQTAIVALPTCNESLVQTIRDLFDVAFRLLTSLGIRDRQYEKAYAGIPAHVCAFCGIEPLNSPAPELPRENLDHYLAISLYPFAGANLRNLPPIGKNCNSSHKLAANMLFDESGGRRRCFDPYGKSVAKVSLLQSKPLRRLSKDLFVLPEWHIDLLGDEEEVSTWDSIFAIRARYQFDVLDEEIRGWVDHFTQWWAFEVGAPPTDAATVVALLRRYISAVIQEGFGNHTFLKRATFEMFEYQCSQPDIGERVVEWIVSLLNPKEGAVVPSQILMPVTPSASD
jgi:hypothetical protein